MSVRGDRGSVVLSRRGLSRCVLVVASAFWVTACSSSAKSASNASTSSTSASTKSTTAASGPPIKVGLVCSCSGLYGGLVTPIEHVYKAWVQAANASGGIDGHPIQLVTEDDAGVPGSSVTAVKTLLGDHVDALVDLSIVDVAWASTAQAAGVPVVGGNVNSVPFSTNPDFYDAGQTADSETVAYVQTLKAAGAKNFGVIYCAESPACSQSDSQLKTLSQKFGPPLTYSISISSTAPNYSAQCLAAQQKHLDALIVEEGATQMAKVTADCAQQGFKPTYVGGDSFGPLMLTTPGMKDNSWWALNNVPDIANTPAVRAMKSALDKSYPGLITNPQEWQNNDVGAWASGVLLSDAVKAGGLAPGATPTVAEVVKGLQSLKGDTLDGLSPPLTFAAGQPHPIDCWFTIRVQNGVESVLNNGKVTCGTTSSP